MVTLLLNSIFQEFLQIFIIQFTNYKDHQRTIDIPTQGEYVYLNKPVKALG